MQEKEVIKKEILLKDLIHLMNKYNNSGYSCFIEGNGDGTVSIWALEEAVYFK